MVVADQNDCAKYIEKKIAVESPFIRAEIRSLIGGMTSAMLRICSDAERTTARVRFAPSDVRHGVRIAKIRGVCDANS